MPEITDIKGVGPVLGDTIKKCGFDSVEQIAGATVDGLAVVPGLGESRAKSLIDAAQTLLTQAQTEDIGAKAQDVMNDVTVAAVDGGTKAAKDTKKEMKGKKDKKGKKKKDKKKKKKNKKNKKKKK